MAGFVIAVVAGVIPLAFGMSGLGRPRVILLVGGLLGVGWIATTAAAEAAHPPDYPETPPLWFFAGLVVLLYAIWCGGLWLGVRLRRMRHATPG
jgi:hypothetical protein